MLVDEVRDLGNGRISWSTSWELCRDQYPDVDAHELQTVTSEGRSQTLRRQSEPGFRMTVTAGENAMSLGLLNRDLLLAVKAGQLAYRVRAVLDENRVSASSLTHVPYPTRLALTLCTTQGHTNRHERWPPCSESLECPS
jgi:hypothetical protein